MRCCSSVSYTHLDVYKRQGWKGNPALKIFCGGEPMQPDLATALLARCGQLWNLYGPTETTVYSTGMRVMPATDGQRWPVIHIGRPLDNTQVWICLLYTSRCV